jgi:outer membrane protein OmpA-like peptidoglycan-associated protein
MRPVSVRRFALHLAVVLAAFTFVQVADAGLGDSIKKKMEEQKKKAEQAAAAKAAEQAAASGTAKPAEGAAPTGTATTGTATAREGKPVSEGSGATAVGTTPAKVSEVSTKFDFVPGDKVIVLDDFTQDDLGEFPARWKPVRGTFEVAEFEGERWLRCMSPDGTIRLRLPEAPSLPEYWTLEFVFLGTEPMESALTVKGMQKGDNTAWEATYPHGQSMWFRSGEFTSDTPLEGITTPAGRHHVMLMARGKGLKVYMDQQRLVNLPEVSDEHGPAMALEIRMWATTHPMITNVRYAEGCKPAQDLLAQGKLVTYGIRFATGSDVVLPDSAPVLRQVANWLTANPAAKLTITGHTDNVGTSAANLDLSKRRAVSVAKVLTEQFSIAADRLVAQGKGDTQTVADNTKPEGRAMNRRVEFAKI